MKRLIALIIITLILLSLLFVLVSALCLDVSACSKDGCFLRAGGGEGGGSSGGGSDGGSGGDYSSSYSSTSGYRSRKENSIIGFFCAIVLVFFPSVFMYMYFSRKARRSKKLMKKFVKKDSAWKYKNVLNTVKKSFYVVQKAWADMDLSSASNYLSDELYSKFQTQLNWMEQSKEKNVLKSIKLIDALPISVYDDSDNSQDYIWFYIKGRMVDYTINTESNQMISGNKLPTSFVEYWKFTRNDNTWVLSKILQEDEADQILL